MPHPIRDFKTWMPLLAVIWGSEPDALASPGSYLAGHVDARGGFGFGWGKPPGLRHSPVRVIRAVAAQTDLDPVAPVRDALNEAAMASISFVAEFFRGGRAVLYLLEFGPAVEDLGAGGIGLGSLVLIEGALFPELYGSDLGGMPEVARVNEGALRSVEAAAGPDLEVLSIGVWEGEPLSLAPVAGLPRLRTLTAYPGALADPLEVTRLPGLEVLELGPGEWRVLLDAGAVPRTLLAAAVGAHDGRNPLRHVAVANEILALWDRPRITQTILEGDLGGTL